MILRSFFACCILILSFSAIHAQHSADQPGIALVGAKIYPSPGLPAIDDGIVLIRDGKIVGVGRKGTLPIPKDDSILDCRGLTLTAAFWNCHVHFIEPKWEGADTLNASRFNRQMEDMITSHGFAHVFDIAALNINTVLKIRNRVRSGDVRGPEIFMVGVPLVPLGGNPIYLEPLKIKLPEAVDSQTVVAHIHQQIESGADGIKMWSGSPTHHGIVCMPDTMTRLITATAHKAGKPVFAHPSSSEGAMVAVRNGVNILAHTTPDDGKPWSDSMIKEMLAADVAVIPTLKLWKDVMVEEGVKDWAHSPFILTGEQQVRVFDKAGGTLLFGTDVGYIPDYNTRDEFTLLAASGLSWSRILEMLTTAPARRFGLNARTGTITAGMDADLVLLKDDPARDVQAFDEVQLTMVRGKIVYKRAL